jgi:nucleotide-binding universal stress UspA family protein
MALHVVSRGFVPDPRLLFGDGPNGLIAARTTALSAEKELQAWLAPAVHAGVKTDTLFAEGRPSSCILQEAQRVTADLVVMGTHGVGGFERLVLGSVAEKVLRTATCPVLTVPPADITGASIPYSRLLCPVDFSESSLAAVRVALAFAEEADAHLSILHVVDWPPDEGLLVERVDAPEFRAIVEGRIRPRLDALVPDDARLWCKPASRVAYGKAYRRILELAERERSDLIVIGVRGRNPIDLAVFGSTTNQIVRHATCPVLTVRS